jgi:hypothetical protein
VTHVLCIAPGKVKVYSLSPAAFIVDKHYINIGDLSSAPASLEEFLPKCCVFLDEIIFEAKGTVLISGDFRGAVLPLAIFFLMKTSRMRLNEAFEYIQSKSKSKRNQVFLPKLKFLLALNHCESDIFGSSERTDQQWIVAAGASTLSLSQRKPSAKGLKGFTGVYNSVGAPEYYSQDSVKCTYRNPHSKKFGVIVDRIIEKLDFASENFGAVLDLACGGGEISCLLQKYGEEKVPNEILGCDPYLHELYRLKTGLQCFDYSFEDIISGKRNCQKQILGKLERKLGVIICSYAMHLCDEVTKLCKVLSTMTKFLCVITPHGLPYITKAMNFEPFYCFKFKNIKVNIYMSSFYSPDDDKS